MSAPWQGDELVKIGEADDLHIAPFRDDGITYGTPTCIWSVAVDGELYVRAYNGQDSRWHQAALRQKAGRITAAGMTKDVVFAPVDRDGPDPGRRAVGDTIITQGSDVKIVGLGDLQIPLPRRAH